MTGTSLHSASVFVGYVYQILLPRIQSKKNVKEMFSFGWIYMSFAVGGSCSNRNHILHLETIFIMSFFICLLFLLCGERYPWQPVGLCFYFSMYIQRWFSHPDWSFCRVFPNPTEDPFYKWKWISYLRTSGTSWAVVDNIRVLALNHITFSDVIPLFILVVWRFPKPSESKIRSWVPWGSHWGITVLARTRSNLSVNIFIPQNKISF